VILSNKDHIFIAKMKIFHNVVGDIIRSIKGGALMGAYVQCFCLIDYLSAIAQLANNDQIGPNYEQFITKYLSSYDAKKLYAIRCALVHTYGQASRMKDADLEGYLFRHKDPSINRLYKEKVYYLNLSNFLFDIIKGTYEFFTELETKSESDLTDYVKRAINIISVFGHWGLVLPWHYGYVDSILSVLDLIEPDWKILENEIYKLCLSK
jgi:hypothetical protein